MSVATDKYDLSMHWFVLLFQADPDEFKPYPTMPKGGYANVPSDMAVNKAPPVQQPSTEDSKNFDIVRATQYGVMERVMELIEGGYDVNLPDRENVTVLHWAAINNRTEIVK